MPTCNPSTPLGKQEVGERALFTRWPPSLESTAVNKTEARTNAQAGTKAPGFLVATFMLGVLHTKVSSR